MAFDLAERSLYEVIVTGQVSRIVHWVDQLSPALGEATALAHWPGLGTVAEYALQPGRRCRCGAQGAPNGKEREVIRSLANNLSSKEIAMALDVSVDAVKWHLKNLFGELNAGSRKHLIDRVRSLGILD